MGTSIKALIMLAVVVGGPAAYLYHGPLPPAVQGVVGRIATVAGELTGGSSVQTDSRASLELEQSCRGGVCSMDLPAVARAPAPEPTYSFTEADSPDEAAVATIDTQTLQPLLDQLLAQGVGEYELSRWGAAGALYRFRCAAPLAGDLQHAQQFEAIAESPTASIQDVVGQVTAWQLTRNQARFVR